MAKRGYDYKIIGLVGKKWRPTRESFSPAWCAFGPICVLWRVVKVCISTVFPLYVFISSPNVPWLRLYQDTSPPKTGLCWKKWRPTRASFFFGTDYLCPPKAIFWLWSTSWNPLTVRFFKEGNTVPCIQGTFIGCIDDTVHLHVMCIPLSTSTRIYKHYTQPLSTLVTIQSWGLSPQPPNAPCAFYAQQGTPGACIHNSNTWKTSPPFLWLMMEGVLCATQRCTL